MFPDYNSISGFLSINPIHSNTRESVAKETTVPYPDSQVILQQELRIRICCTLSINKHRRCMHFCACILCIFAQVPGTCFDHRYSTAVLAAEV